MFLLIEIILTVVAWRKGWRSKALLPMAMGYGAAVVLGLVIGLSVGQSGGSVARLEGVFAVVGLALDFLMLTSLAVMIAKAPGKVTVATQDQVADLKDRPLVGAPQV